MVNNQQTLILKHRFNDFDAFTSSLPDWQVRFKQLDQGAFVGEIEQIITTGVTIKRCHFNRRIEQLGVAPPGCRTFGITQKDHTSFYWRRHSVEAGNLLSFSDDVELEGVSAPGFHLYAVSINEELLAEAAQRLGYESQEEIMERENVVKPSADHMAGLRRYCQAFIAPGAFSPEAMPFLIKEIHEDLPGLILEAFVSGEKLHPVSTPLARRKALRLTREAIRDSLEPITSVAELCRLTNVGERTLRYAFMETFGVSPKAYLHSVRLNAVRQILLLGDQKTLIADAANQQGFWHMGQFAADYQKMFGELPSETLKKPSCNSWEGDRLSR